MCHRPVYTGDDIFFIRRVGELADDFALREDRTGGADLYAPCRLRAELSQLRDLDLKYARHDVQKASRTRGTLIIHLEIGHRAVVNMHYLDVLPAYIDDGVDLREQVIRAAGVA